MTPKVYVPVKTGKRNNQVEVSITVEDFKLIFSTQLRLEYDPNVLTFVRHEVTPTMTAISAPIVSHPVYGGIQMIRIVWSGVKPATLKNKSVLVKLIFKCAKTAGETILKWNNTAAGGHDCEFCTFTNTVIKLPDGPENYINGKITVV